MKMENYNLLNIEKSIIKRYRKEIWVPLIKAIDYFNLIEENDKIAVAVSGGKDSMLLAKSLILCKRISKINFDLKFIAMDPGFNDESLNTLKNNCKELNIPIIIKKSDIFDVTKKIAEKNPCYMCARMRRGFLYQFAKENGCNKLALGHHFDDVIETTFLNILYGSQFKTMIPKIKAENFTNMTLIRPMVYIKEKDIIRWANYTKLNYQNCSCSLEKTQKETKRKEIKDLIKQLEKDNPNVKMSIFKSSANVNINQVYGYSFNDTKEDFNEIFNKTTIKKDEND